jgi:hypothetical protein
MCEKILSTAGDALMSSEVKFLQNFPPKINKIISTYNRKNKKTQKFQNTPFFFGVQKMTKNKLLVPFDLPTI